MKNWNYIEGAKTGNAGITDKEFNSENEMRRWCIEHNYTSTPVGGGYYRLEDDSGKNRKDLEAHVKAGNKTGNDTAMEYATRKPKVINEEKTGAEEFFKQLSDDVKEREEKDDEEIEKVGNREIYVNQSEQTKAVVYEDGTIMLWDKNGNNYKTIKAGSLEEARNKLNSDYKKVGNASVGGGTYASDDGSKKAVVDITNLQSGSTRVVWIEDGRQTGSNEYRSLQSAIDACKRKGLKKVGNATYDMTDRDYENEYKSLVQKRNNVQKGTKEYEEIQKRLDEIRKKLGRSPFGNKIGNSKVKKTLFKSLATPTTWTPGINGRPISGAPEFKGTFAKDEAEKWTDKWIKDHGFEVENKTGNSASDDKFAYVMREFDEGKLKTPDGKVVTDPAQAKAIAYSESKKTENGLARARNAMNKKCGNSQVTLWKGNDSVLISEDGTVQYLESNSFETDRDKYGSMQEAIDDLTKKGYRKK